MSSNQQVEVPLRAKLRERFRQLTLWIWESGNSVSIVLAFIIGALVGGIINHYLIEGQRSFPLLGVAFVGGIVGALVEAFALNWFAPRARRFARAQSKYSYGWDYLDIILATSNKVAILAGDLSFLWDDEYKDAREELKKRGGRGMWILCHDPKIRGAESRRLEGEMKERITELTKDFDVGQIVFHSGELRGLLSDEAFGVLTHEQMTPGWFFSKGIHSKDVRNDYVQHNSDPLLVNTLWELIDNLSLTNRTEVDVDVSLAHQE